MKKFACLATLLACAAYSQEAYGQATLTYSGVQRDVEAHTNDPGVGWRNTTPAKVLDVSGDNILGTDGYSLFGGTASLPSYVSGITLSNNVGLFFSASGSYALIDNPSNPAGADQGSGAAFINGATALTEYNMFSFTLTGNVPSTIGLSFMVDNSDNVSSISGNTLHLQQTGGSGTSIGFYSDPFIVNSQPDWYTFTVSGAQAGDTFLVSELRGGTAGTVQVGAIAFDTASAIPEPSSAILMMLGGLGVAALTFLRRKTSATA